MDPDPDPGGPKTYESYGSESGPATPAFLRSSSLEIFKFFYYFTFFPLLLEPDRGGGGGGVEYCWYGNHFV
jgi:hypothetical protein